MLNILVIAGLFLTGLLVVGLRQYILFYLIPRQLLAAEALVDTDPRQALDILGRVRALDRHNPRVHWLAARAHLHNKQQVLAKMHLFDILHVGVFNDEVTEQMIREALAKIYRDLDDTEKALLQYYLLREQRLLSLSGYKSMIHLLIEKGSLPQAEQILAECKNKNPLDGELHYLDALCQFEKKEFTTAEARAVKASELFYRSHNLTLLLAKLFFINKKFSRALTLFQSLPQEVLPAGDLGNLLGQCFFHIKDYGAAIEMLESNLQELRESHRDLSDTAFVLGSAYENSGKTAEAVAIWKEVGKGHSLHALALEKIKFYTEILSEPALQKLLTMPLHDWRVLTEELLKKLGYEIKEKLLEDEKNLRFLAANKDNYYNLENHIICASRQPVPFKQTDLEAQIKAVQNHRAKYLCILAPYVSPVVRAGLTDEWTRLLDFELYLTEGIVKKA